MTNRRIKTLRSLVETGLQALAFVSLARKLGPRRIGRVAVLAAEGYLAHPRGRRGRGQP